MSENRLQSRKFLDPTLVVRNYHKLQSDLESDGAEVQPRSCFIFISAREKPADLHDCVVVLQLSAARADVPAVPA